MFKSTYFSSLLCFSLLNAPLSAKDSLKATSWADKSMVKNLVSISVDDNGDVYVSETARRKAADLDIRQHRDWIPDDVSFQTVEDKRAFFMQQLSPSRSEENKAWLKDNNNDGSHDYRDLAAIKDKIYLLKDTNDDGRADQVTTYASDLGEEVSGIAAGVLIHEGEVYTTIAPDVYKMKDTNGDGVYDEKVSIAHGFGLHIAYAGHDMHGLRVGPDGRIYWSIGDKGVSVVDKNGKRHHYPNQGAVLRCNPDGSDFKVFAYGLRNVQEFAFDEYGNMFGIDNDSDRTGELERFVYITEDSDSGWRCNYQYRGAGYNPWMEEKLWVPHHPGQASYITPPISNYVDGPTGFAYNPGTALSKGYEKHFFLTMFPRKTIMAFQTQAKGAGFEMTHSEKVYEGINLTGLSFGPNGKLWASDWGGGYALNDVGGVWNFDVEEQQEHPMRQDTHNWLQRTFSKLAPSELITGLNHPDQRVRLKSQFELVKRNLTAELLHISQSENAHELARVHAIWGIGQLYRTKPTPNLTEHLEQLLKSQQSEMIVQALKVIADTPKAEFDGDLLLPLFKHSSARVNHFAAKAIGKHPNKKREVTTRILNDLLIKAKGTDTFLRHGVVLALSGAYKDLELAELSKHENVDLKLAAVVALRRQKSPEIRVFLKDSNELVVTEAARAIYDDFSIFEALPDLANVIEQDMTSPALWRRVLNSQYRQGSVDNVKRLAHFVADESKALDQRVEALDVLTTWVQPDWRDRVNGRFRKVGQQDLNPIKKELQKHLAVFMKSPQTKLQGMAAKLSSLLNIKADPETLLTWLKDEQRELKSRLDALNFLMSQATYREQVVEYAVSSNIPELRATAASLYLKEDPSRGMKPVQTVLKKGSNWEKQQVINALAAIDDKKSASTLTKLLDKLVKNEVSKDLAFELLEASQKRGLDGYVEKYNQTQQKSDPKMGAYTPLMHGGNPKAGKRIFNEHLSAQCIRCHALGGVGSAVGPDLAGIAKKQKADYLLESLIFPGNEIAKGFGITTITLKSGSIVAGSVHDENKTHLQIKSPDGKINQVARKDIASQTPAISMMPSMKGILSNREIRDVVAYLTELK